MPLEFAFLDRAEVGEPVVVHHPRIEVRSFNLRDGLPLAKVESAELHEGRCVGSTTSVAWGHRVGKLLAFAYLQPESAVPGTDLEVVIMNERTTRAFQAFVS